MEITFTKRWGSSDKETTKDLSSIVEESAYERDNVGSLERVRAIAEASIKFNASLVAILHRRGVLNDQEVIEIADKFISIDTSKEVKIKHD
jgi:hypothetical protein